MTGKRREIGGQAGVIVLDQLGHRGPDDVEDQVRAEAEDQRRSDERREDRLLAGAHVLDRLQAFLDEFAEDDPAIEPQRVGGRQDHARRRHQRHPGVDLEGAHHGQEFTDEARGARQADVGHGEEHEDQRIARHPHRKPAIGVDLAGVHPVVDHADRKEQRPRDEAVAQHLEDRAVDALLVRREDAHGDIAHVRHRRIGDQLLHVGLRKCHQRGVDDGDRRHPEHHRGHHLSAHREHRQREAQEAVAAHLQHHRRQDHRARRRRLNVRVGQPGVHRPHRHLHREGGEEGEEQQRLHAADDVEAQHREAVGRELVGQQRDDVGGARIHVHRDHRHQHQHRAEEGVEEELEGRVDPVRPAPDADDQEHRDQRGFEEQVEQHQIQRGEHTDHQPLEREEGDHVFLDPLLDVPGRGDGQRHHEGGKQHEQDRDPVDAHLVLQAHDPVALFEELEAGVRGIKATKQEQRDQERCRGDQQRRPFRIAVRRGRSALQHQRQDRRRYQGSERDDGKKVFH
ncbi:hypothetical protein SDC9_20661 [bioreactor metagenome]|uniref:Uncharacterized protein n=1 Tax=bioreactor metagenome TaxID=1076179 RepID=A0A644U7P4_9ZZZZ